MSALPHTFKSRRTGFLIGIIVAVVGTSAAYAVSGDDGTTPGRAGFRAAETPVQLETQLRVRLAEAGRSDLAPSPASTFEVSRVSLEGSDWLMASYENAAGQRCVMEAVPGEGRGIGCRDRATLFGASPLAISWGTRQTPGGSLEVWDVAWITGLTTSAVHRVRLVFTDCSVREQTLRNDGSFFTVLGEDVMHGAAWPSVVRAVDANGRQIGQQSIDLESENAKGTMIEGPEPLSDCS